MYPTQVHGRRIEHDLVCQELSSLHASISQALSPAELDSIRHRAEEAGKKHGAEPAIVALCEQIENDVRSARAKLLQTELQRLSLGQDVESSMAQMGTTDSASLVKKLQELVKTFPESGELRGMLLRAQESLERAERARNEATTRASAIDLEVKAYTRLLESRQAAKALSSLEEAAEKYSESEQLQSLLLQCREQIDAEQETKRQANAKRRQCRLRSTREPIFSKTIAMMRLRRCLRSPASNGLATSNSRRCWLQRHRKRLTGKPRSKRRSGSVSCRLRKHPRERHAKCLSFRSGACLLWGVLGVLIRYITRPHVSVLTVASTPSGAEIEVDGSKCTTPNCSFKLSPGATYNVTADLKGYVSRSQSVASTRTRPFRSSSPGGSLRTGGSCLRPIQAPLTARLMLKGVHSGDQLFVDDVRLPVSGPPGTWELTPGSHRLRLMAGTQELVADPRSFKPNATVVLNRADFKQPAPATSEEQLAWTRINSTADTAAVEDFLRRYPNSSFRAQAESKLENLDWSKVSGSGSLRAFQDYAAQYTFPPGPHLPAALAEIARLEWEAIQNTTDPLQVKRFLDQNPSGQYHDRAVSSSRRSGLGGKLPVRATPRVSRATWAAILQAGTRRKRQRSWPG